MKSSDSPDYKDPISLREHAAALLEATKEYEHDPYFQAALREGAQKEINRACELEAVMGRPVYQFVPGGETDDPF